MNLIIRSILLMFFMSSTLVNVASAKIWVMPKKNDDQIKEIAKKYYISEQKALTFDELFKSNNLRECLNLYVEHEILTADKKNKNIENFAPSFLDYNKAHKLPGNEKQIIENAEKKKSKAVSSIVEVLDFKNFLNHKNPKIRDRVLKKINEYAEEMKKDNVYVYLWKPDDSNIQNSGTAIVRDQGKHSGKSKAYLIFFLVDKPGNGCGKMMMSELMTILRKKYDEIELVAEHDRLISFYKNCGFESNGPGKREMLADLNIPFEWYKIF